MQCERRSFGQDLLVCPACGHRPLRVIAAIDDPPLVDKILAHLGLPTECPIVAPARFPPQLDVDEDLGDPDVDVN